MGAKRYNYKVYDSAGTYIKTWNDVINDLKFKTAIGTGVGEFEIELARAINDFGENDDVAFNNKVEIRVFDEDSGTTGVLIASGRITRYTPNIDGKSESLSVQCLGYVHRLAQVPYIESGNTRIEKATTDPSTMFQAVFDAFGTESGETEPDYDGSSVDATGLSETYEFNSMTCFDALRKIIEMCPSEWYWYIDGDNTAYLRQKATTATHTFAIGKAAQAIQAQKNIETVVNKIYFTGGLKYTTYKDQQNATFNSGRALGHSSIDSIAQSFIPEKNAISGVSLYKNTGVGTAVMNLTLSIQPDLDGLPSGDTLVSQDITADWQAAADGTAIAFELPETALVVGEKYWIVIETDTQDSSNHYSIGQTTASYANGECYIEDGGTWTLEAVDLYFETYYPANLFKVYSNAVSISEYGEQAIFKQDERITNEDSMDQIADAILDVRRFPEVRMSIRVMDNNNNPFGYDIETIKPGDTCYIRNLIDQDYSKWDIAVWDQSYWDRSLGNIQELLVQIQSVEYTPDHVILELSTRPPRLAETIEQIERDIQAAKVNDNPDAPST